MKEKIVVKLPGNLIRELEQLKEALEVEKKSMLLRHRLQIAAIQAYNQALGPFINWQHGDPLCALEQPVLPAYCPAITQLIIKIDNLLSLTDQLPKPE